MSSEARTAVEAGNEPTTRDVVVVGASAGGVEALSQLVSHLPGDYSAGLAVVLHLPNAGPSVLPKILARVTPLDVVAAEDATELRPGRIHVAPAGTHLVFDGDRLRLEQGPRENGHRPAIDRLFRSAAASFGPRVAGVVLSGMLDDGVAGLASIRANGGLTIAQDPASAHFPGMPQAALDAGTADYSLPVEEIAGLLALAAQGSVLPVRPLPGTDSEHVLDDLVGRWRAGVDAGLASGFSCPECAGSLWSSVENGIERYRCHIGHAYSPESLLAMQNDRIEAALWSARASLEQRAAFLLRLAGRMRDRGQERFAARYEGQARALNANAETIRRLAASHGTEPVEPIEAV